MRRALLATIVSTAISFAACGGGSNPPEPGGSTGGGETVTGRERIGWTQAAANESELSTYRYALYIDNQRRVLEGETCTATAGGTAAVNCSAPLPALGAGRHTLELAAFFMSGDTVVEGARSSVLQVTVAGEVASSAGQVVQGGTFVSSDGVTLHAEILARDLLDPIDLSVTPDDRVFVAERRGRLRIIAEDPAATPPADNLLPAIGDLTDADGAALLSVALTPEFASSGMLHIALVTTDRHEPVIRIVRLRESGGLLGQSAVVASYPVSALDIQAVLRFGPDARLYVGIGTGSDADDAQNLSAVSGKILRLRADGTTPDDNPASSPILSAGHRDPRGLVWLPQDQSLWEVERDDQGDEINRIRSGANYGWPLVRERPDHPGISPPILVLRSGIESSGMTIVPSPSSPLFGDLIVSSVGARDLLRFRLTTEGQPRLAGRLLDGRYGRIAQVASGADGALYFVTANRDEWGAGQDVLVRVRAQGRSPRIPHN